MEGRKISLCEARQLAMKVLTEAEKNLHEERMAEARFIVALWDTMPLEPLGRKFEQVLNDNYYDLIVCT